MSSKKAAKSKKTNSKLNGGFSILCLSHLQKVSQVVAELGTHFTFFVGNAKLEHSKKEGTSKNDCTLILTEGDPAKNFVVTGLGVIGRNYYGVFPLDGELLRARDATPEQLEANPEIENIVKVNVSLMF